MRIISSEVQLSAARLFEATQTVSEKLRIRIRPAGSDHHHHRHHHGGDRFELATRDGSDPIAELARTLAKFRSSQRQPAASGEGSGPEAGADGLRFRLSYRRRETYRETEALSFRASGSVSTADGRHIDFSQALDLARSFARTETISLKLSGVIGPTAQPSSQTEAAAAAPPLAAVDATPPTQQALSLNGSILALDANGDGTIDPATELIGGSGDGFAELAQHDEDGNGFIDEGDSAFSKLVLVDRAGEGLEAGTLASRGVGAIYTGSVATPYTVTDAHNQPLARLARSGIYLNENGTTGIAQQVNVLV